MSDRCRTIKGVHIPGCMGCAAMGHHRCTCEPTERPPKREPDVMTVLRSIERRLARLEARAGGQHPEERGPEVKGDPR